MTREEKVDIVIEVLEDWHGVQYGNSLIKEAVGSKPLKVLDLVLAEKIVDALDEHTDS